MNDEPNAPGLNNEEVSEIVSKLSKNLQDELQFELKGNILNKAKVFQNFST